MVKKLVIHKNNELQIFSDLNCTWCYFDKPSIKRLGSEYDIEVVWRAFPLHSDIPEEGLSIENLFGNNIPLMIDKMQQLENKAFSLGLPLAKRKFISNSRLAQELAKWAQTRGRLEEYHDAIYQAYFADGLNIADPIVLLDAAEASELSREEAQSVLDKRSFSHVVDQDWERCKRLDIMVAPTYLLNNDRLTGSQSYENLEDLLRKNDIKKRTVT